jgi:methylmalonyl-CoA/ethylmalonyl-CoA epimerase
VRVVDDRPDQLGFVTDDLERMTEQLSALWGVDSWSRHNYTSDTLRHRSFRGGEGQYESRNAVSPGGRLGVVQPVRGPSVHLEVLESRGPGLAYVSWFVEDLHPWEQRMREQGVEEVMRGGGHGLDGDGEFVYFDTRANVGVFTQYVVPPRRRRPPSS